MGVHAGVTHSIT